MPDAADNFLTFSATVEAPAAADGVARGALTVHFGKPADAEAGVPLAVAACSGVVWPQLQTVRFLGVHWQVKAAR